MIDSINMILDLVKITIGILALFSVYFAGKTYYSNRNKAAKDLQAAKDKELCKIAERTLEIAYEALTKGGEEYPLSDRLNWITAARHILWFQELKLKIKTDYYGRICLENEEYWRHKFYMCLAHNGVLLTLSYFENIDKRSAYTVVAFADWNMDRADPLDKVDKNEIDFSRFKRYVSLRFYG